MPLSALALVLLAAVLHASWNIAAKHAGGDQRFHPDHQLAHEPAVVALRSVVWLARAARWGWGEWAVISASSAVHLLYFNALLTGYRVGDMTVVYPLARGSAPLVTAAAAVLLLGETLSLLGVAGVLAVCGGVFLIAGGPALWRHAHDAAHRERTIAGVRWGLITGLMIAGYSVIDGYAIKVLARPCHLRLRVQRAAGVAAVAHAAARARRPGAGLARSGDTHWWCRRWARWPTSACSTR